MFKRTDFNAIFTEIENKIPSVTGLVTTANNLATKEALNTKATDVKSKTPGITNLATKAALNTKTTDIENKTTDATSFIITPELNRLTKISFDAKIKEAAKSLASESQEYVLDIVDENIKEYIKKPQMFDLSYFSGKNYFENNGMQSYLLFQCSFEYLKTSSGKSYDIIAWKCNGLSEESIKTPATSNISLAPGMTFLMVLKLKCNLMEVVRNRKK